MEKPKATEENTPQMCLGGCGKTVPNSGGGFNYSSNGWCRDCSKRFKAYLGPRVVRRDSFLGREEARVSPSHIRDSRRLRDGFEEMLLN
jgi:hypothetical protein